MYITKDMDINKITPHENTVLRVGAYIASKQQGIDDPIKIGKYLMSMGSDEMVPGGFWVWKISTNKEFYSPNFREVLGFEGENDFPNVAESWQNQIEDESLNIALGNLKLVLEAAKKADIDDKYCSTPYRQMVTYNTKSGEKIELFCSGTLLLDEKKPTFLVGTHKIKRK